MIFLAHASASGSNLVPPYVALGGVACRLLSGTVKKCLSSMTLDSLSSLNQLYKLRPRAEVGLLLWVCYFALELKGPTWPLLTMDEHRLLSPPHLFQIKAFRENILNRILYVFEIDQRKCSKIFPSFDFLLVRWVLSLADEQPPQSAPVISKTWFT